MKNRYTAIILVALLFSLVSMVALAAPPFPHSTGNSYGCSVCHNALTKDSSKGYNNICIACHNPNDPKGSKFPFTEADVASRGGSVMSRYSGGIAPAKIFQTSHGWTGSSVNASVGSVTAVGGSLNASRNISGQLLCYTCHNVHGSKAGADGSGHFLRASPDDMCLDCHRNRNNQSHQLGSHPVNISISSAKLRSKPNEYQLDATNKYLKPINSNPANPTAAMTIKNGKILCTSCHGVHYADSNSATFDNASGNHYSNLSTSTGSLLKSNMFGKTPGDTNICTSCHKPTAHSTMGNAQCADCHSAHVEYDPKAVKGENPNAFLLRRYVNMSANIKLAPLVPNKIGEITAYRQRVTYNVVYNALSSTTVKAATQMVGACTACHVKPSTSTAVPEHGNTDPASCNTCHSVATGLGAPSNNLACGKCHGMPPVKNIWGTYSSVYGGYAVFSSAKSPNKSGALITQSYKVGVGSAAFKSEYSTAHRRHQTA